MKLLALPLALAVSVSAVAEDEWVSVGANQPVAPAETTPAAEAITPPSLPFSSESLTATTQQPSANNTNNGDLISELLTQIEQMQQEIAMLRSQVETQGNQLSTLEQDQQARYLDLDRRVASLITAKPVTKAAAPATAHSVSADVAVTIPAVDAYKAAMTLVREKKYAEANLAFTRFTQTYGEDPLIANAYYWNGEVYLVQGEFEQAQQSFQAVVDKFANHAKAADASYKLGVTLHKLDKTEEAKRWLTQVVERYSGKADSTVRLAKAYLDKIGAAQ